jgi:cysteinyl-tRNA synthetase
MHNGFLQMGDEKMSKSLGNLITVREGLDKYGGDALRVFVLGSGYRSPLTYSEEAIEAGKNAAERLRTALEARETSSSDPVDASGARERFIAALEDDLNTSQALAALFELARDINRGRDAGRSIAAAQQTMRELAGVLGLRLESEGPTAAAPFIELLIEVRRDLRQARQFELADRIRNSLTDLGVVLEDSASGTTWKSR